MSLLMRIAPDVEAAATLAGSIAPRFAVPFPGFGQQGRFQAEMARIVPFLPRLGMPRKLLSVPATMCWI